jgi:hypothetical protein
LAALLRRGDTFCSNSTRLFSRPVLTYVTAQWALAPAYDLTFSSGPGGEQSMPVLGEGRSPGAEHLRALAKKHGLKQADAVIDEVRAALEQWPEYADQAGLTKKSAKLIADRIAPPRIAPQARKPRP